MGKIPTKLKWKHGKGAKRVTALKTKRKKNKITHIHKRKGKTSTAAIAIYMRRRRILFPRLNLLGYNWQAARSR